MKGHERTKSPKRKAHLHIINHITFDDFIKYIKQVIVLLFYGAVQHPYIRILNITFQKYRLRGKQVGRTGRVLATRVVYVSSSIRIMNAEFQIHDNDVKVC